jgi:hypothetical protein
MVIAQASVTATSAACGQHGERPRSGRRAPQLRTRPAAVKCHDCKYQLGHGSRRAIYVPALQASRPMPTATGLPRGSARRPGHCGYGWVSRLPARGKSLVPSGGFRHNECHAEYRSEPVAR